MNESRTWRHFDYVLLLVTILLTAYGVLMVYSANQGSLDPDMHDLWRRQAIISAAGVGLVFLLAVLPPDYEWLGDFWWLAYSLAAIMLMLVFSFGQRDEVTGRMIGWFDLGVFRLQPSFLAMNLFIVALAAILGRRRKKRGSSAPVLFGAPKTSMLAEETSEHPDIVNYIASLVMTLLLTTLIFFEPDMATAAVFVFIWGIMLFQAQIPIRYLVLTALIALVALIPLWNLMARYPYMHERILGFLDPSSHEGIDYQIRQATIAIGSGGLLGKNLGQGTQSQLRYLPVRHTDFIFAVIAEELGFVGVILLFALYLILFFRLLRIILITASIYGRLLVAGTFAMILFQLIVNIGMNLGMLPVAGLPLPFISYGPTALLTTMIGIGLAENVSMRHRKPEFQSG